ncbi:MAG: galactose mutarotase [Clostridia bacterium]|nr:galactose mutarotase [Clostridia bacterium]
MSIEKRVFGTTKDNRDVYSYCITNKNSVSACIITYGGTLQSLKIKDKHGTLRDILVGFDTVEGFEDRCDYQGVLVGRYANRISGGSFEINGTKYNVTKNEKDITCLHGGGEMSSALWDVRVISENSVEVSYTSPDGAEGFPGTLKTSVVYTLTDDNELSISYSAVCDKDSFINLTNHAYFNLGGYDSGDILNTLLTINASHYTPTDENSIPTGELRSVEGTAFDFREEKAIGRDINDDDEQLIMCRGYDHNFCLDKTEEANIKAFSPSSGIGMEVYTDLPGVQLYTGNFLNGTQGKKELPMYKHAGFCLETQFYPDTPNRPEFPSCLYKAGEEFRSTTSFKLFVK